MVKVNRLNEVLDRYNNIFNNTIDKKIYQNFKVDVLNEYEHLYKSVNDEIENEYYKNYAIAVVALYKVMHNKYDIDINNSIQTIYILTYKCTESIFLDLSFVQMAYYLICDKLYLKRLMLNSLSEFEPSEMFDFMDEEELEKNRELDNDKLKKQVCDYFNKQDVSELKSLLDLVDEIIEKFVDDNFSRKQKSFSLEDIF